MVKKAKKERRPEKKKGKGTRICPCGGIMDEVRNGWVCRDCGTLVKANHPLKQRDG